MSQTDSQLLTEAGIIKNETTAGANTAGRIGTMYEDIINSKVNNLLTSSFVTNSQTSSFVTTSQTSSFVQNSQTSSFVQNSSTSSFVTNNQTGSFVTTSQTSSFVQNNQTSSFVTNNQTGSFQTTSSFNSYTGSVTSQFAGTSSYATTASYALNGGGGTVNTASLLTTASAAGNTITFTKGDNTTFDVTVSGGTGAPGGSNTQIQFNSASVFQGNTAFTFNYISGSLQQGVTVSATGQYSHAQGVGTTASGIYSHAEGQNTLASNQSSHAEGATTIASGQGSHAEGQNTLASGTVAHTEGHYTTASGNYSHAEGRYTLSGNVGSHAEGYYTAANGQQSHAEGSGSVATGASAHAEGSVTVASGISSHAEGEYNLANGQGSHAEGYFVTASGGYSHAEGEQTKATGNTSHAEGYLTVASGVYSHAEGDNTKAKNTGAHAEGAGTAAHGTYSHAEGDSTVASGSHSHTEGEKTIALDDYQHVQGTYNIATLGKAALIVGNGYYDYDTDIEYRSNLIYASGSILQVSGTLEINPNSGPNVTPTVANVAKFIGENSFIMDVVVGDQPLTAGYQAAKGSIGSGDERLQVKYGNTNTEWGDVVYNLYSGSIDLTNPYNITYPGVYEIGTSGANYIELPAPSTYPQGQKVTIINKTDAYAAVSASSGVIYVEGSTAVSSSYVSARSMTEFVSDGTDWRTLPSLKQFTYLLDIGTSSQNIYTKGTYVITATGNDMIFPDPAHFNGESITVINYNNSGAAINNNGFRPKDMTNTAITEVPANTSIICTSIDGAWYTVAKYS